jgi:hypothetical protein
MWSGSDWCDHDAQKRDAVRYSGCCGRQVGGRRLGGQRRTATHPWDFSSRPYGSTRYRQSQRRVSYFSGDLSIPTDLQDVVTGPMRVTRRPYRDSVVGNQQFRDYPDGSVDFLYRYPGRIPLVMLDEEIHTGWDGRIYRYAPKGWQQGAAQCDPVIYTWLQLKNKDTGAFPALTGSVDSLIGPTRRVRVIWSLQRPPTPGS